MSFSPLVYPYIYANTLTGSGGHHATVPAKNPHANLTPEERLERFLMIVENQFGADNVNPIADPKLPPLDEDEAMQDADAKDGEDADAADSEVAKQERLEARRRAELERLHKIGIPVPGIHIKVDKMEATVWLENLEVECAHKAFADRVSRICDRAAEITAPLWQKR